MFSAEEAEDWDWYEPAPDGTLHQMPDLDGSLPCCGRRIDSLQVGEGTTSDPDRVTC